MEFINIKMFPTLLGLKKDYTVRLYLQGSGNGSKLLANLGILVNLLLPRNMSVRSFPWFPPFHSGEGHT